MLNMKYLLAGILVAVAGLGLLFLGVFGNREGASPRVENGFKETEAFSRDVDDLPEAQPTEMVALKDGDTYEMEMSAVKKKVGSQWVRMLAYNESIPGPTLSITEGAQVTIRIKNNLDIQTTLHSHGVRMDNGFDGVPDMTQAPIAPGETFAYQLKFPDAGVYWYHPHVRTDYTIESGLYGNYIVTPTDANYWAPANREVTLMLDDVALDDYGLLPFQKQIDHVLMGRFGDTMLVNGGTDYTLTAKQGEVVRLYLTNAANTRVFNVMLPNVKMKLVGADVGKYEREEWVEEVLLGPGERRVVEVLFEKPGMYQVLHKTPGKQYVLGTVSVTSEMADLLLAGTFSSVRTNEAVMTDAEILKRFIDAPVAKSLRLTLDMNGRMQHMMRQGGMMGGGHMMSDGTMMSGDAMGGMMGQGDDGDAIEWEDTMSAMNQVSTPEMVQWKLEDTVTKKTNMDVNDWTFKKGDHIKIRIFNDPQSMHPMQHPIHFHGQRFMVLAVNGARNNNPVWQDTTLIPKGDTVDILLEASNPGKWMAHCHIVEHAEGGMMMPFIVE